MDIVSSSRGRGQTLSESERTLAQETFLKSLENATAVRSACKQSGVSHTMVYLWAESDTEFAAKFNTLQSALISRNKLAIQSKPKPIRKREHREPSRIRFEAYRRKYGLSEGEYWKMLVDQNNACCICQRPFGDDRRPHVDHCHITNKVRGILCSQCNTGMGLLGDDPDMLHSAIKYLDQ